MHILMGPFVIVYLRCLQKIQKEGVGSLEV